MIVQTFTVAFLISFIGSVPPGAINISVMQLSMQKHQRAAWFLALGATMIELIYAGLTVQFQIFLTTHEQLSTYFQLTTALALIALGVWNLVAHPRPISASPIELKGRQGFSRGLVLGTLNPMTIPFWLAITLFLQANEWVKLSGQGFWAYLLGLSSGTFLLLLSVSALGRRFTQIADNAFIVYRLPGVSFLVMGGYYLVQLLS